MILLNDFKRQWEDTKDAVLGAVSAVGESGWYILGEQTKCFEAALAQCWGMRYAVGVASGLDAIEIALRILGCKPGDKVLTTPLSAFATTLAIVKTGATPVFVDTDCCGLIDLEQCRSLLARHREIRFMVPVHLYGHTLDLAALSSLREEFGCAIVEDCAQSILSSSNGAAAGSVGDLAATSFYPTKNLGALGDGGAILTNREQFVSAARVLRDYGQTRKYQHDEIGCNSRLDELQAAIMARAYLPRLAAWTDRRRQIARSYREGIRHGGIQVIEPPANCDPVWHLFPVRVNPVSKAGFMQYLRANGISSGEHYPMLIPDQQALHGVPHELTGSCPIARGIAASEVSLPIHPYLTDGEVDKVIEACNRWRG